MTSFLINSQAYFIRLTQDGWWVEFLIFLAAFAVILVSIKIIKGVWHV